VAHRKDRILWECSSEFDRGPDMDPTIWVEGDDEVRPFHLLATRSLSQRFELWWEFYWGRVFTGMPAAGPGHEADYSLRQDPRQFEATTRARRLARELADFWDVPVEIEMLPFSSWTPRQ